jgi:ceramide glucosyltransferase
MHLPVISLVLFALAAAGMISLVVELSALQRLRSKKLPEPREYPAVSLLKPLCGLDDELQQNLESHLAIDYPAEWEIVLGVRSTSDLAYPVARDFAAAHPERVRLVMQQGEPGHNPKVNQLITLTRAARFPVIAMTDSNIRVHPGYLREHAALLSQPGIGLSSHLFVGVGERTGGAAMDNMTMSSVACPSLAAANLILGVDQVVGKSIAIRRDVLAEVGGWHELKDVLAEDQRLGHALRLMGKRIALSPNPVQNVQVDTDVDQFFGRQARWAMIRFRVFPAAVLEPIQNPFVLALVGAWLAWSSPAAWAFAGAMAMASMMYTQAASVVARGRPFEARHLLLVPVRDVLYFLAWARGATMRRVTWRGTRLHVLARTRLAEPHALTRARNMRAQR